MDFWTVEAEVTNLNPRLGEAPDEVTRDSPRDTVVGYLLACREGRFDLAARELDVRFLLHGSGPVSDWAASAAAIGGTFPLLFIPSVSKIMIRDFALWLWSLPTPVPIAEPMAVPSSTMPVARESRRCRSQS